MKKLNTVDITALRGYFYRKRWIYRRAKTNLMIGDIYTVSISDLIPRSNYLATMTAVGWISTPKYLVFKRKANRTEAMKINEKRLSFIFS